MNEHNHNQKIYEVALGALLHDIGKFLQRAEVELDAQSEGMANYICPTRPDGGPSHLHVLYTNYFFENVLGRFPSELDKSQVANLASYHHKPDEPIRVIIQQADHASSGSDRRHREDERDVKKFREQGMKSIFSSVRLRENEVRPLYYVLGALDPGNKEIYCPRSEQRVPQQAYRDLYEAFCRDLDRIPTDSLKLYLESLVSLLRTYAWCILSDTVGEPDVPLFDHLFTTSAIACALYQYHEEKGDLDHQQAIADKTTEKLMFLVGDLSGIQKFLFDLLQPGGRGVSKVLRGRSFLLSLLSLAASEYILDELNLPPVCKVIDAAGRFKIILPYTEHTLETIQRIRRVFDRYCLETFKGELSINLALSSPLTLEDFKQSRYRDILDDAYVQVEREKMRPLTTALDNRECWEFSQLYVQLGQNEDCPHCGKEPAGEGEAQDERGMGTLCRWAFKIGQQLPRARFLVLEKAPGNQTEAFFDSIMPRLLEEQPSNRNVLFLGSISERSSEELFPQLDISNYIPTYAAEDLERYLKEETDDEERQWIHPGMPKTFQHIAQDSTGVKMLGVYKADLDRLGLVFSEGLGDKLSLSREATLSRMLNFFFTRCLTRFLQKHYPNTYTVFSGGDDLSLFGPWDSIIRLAKHLNDEFREFVGDNPNLTLSAGVELIHPRYPAGRAVHRADDALEMSKEGTGYTGKSKDSFQGRNCLTLFGHTLHWGKSLEQYLEFSEQLSDHLSDSNSPITAGFLYRLLNYYREYRSYRYPKDGKPDLRGLLYLPHLKYDIARNITESRKKRKEEAERLMSQLLQSVPGEDQSLFIDHLPVSLFITLYKERGKNETKGEKE